MLLVRIERKGMLTYCLILKLTAMEYQVDDQFSSFITFFFSVCSTQVKKKQSTKKAPKIGTH